MERLQFRCEGGRVASATASARLVGVVASGNLEVLIEPIAEAACAIDVQTAAHGFAPIWQAVMADFFARHPLSGVRISINDAGATPAIVSLRLDQAVEAFSAERAS